MFILFLFGSVLLLIFLFLLVPIEMELKFSKVERSLLTVRVGWLFGHVWKDINGENITSSEKPFDSNELMVDGKGDQKRSDDTKIRIQEILQILKIVGFFQNLERLVRELTYAVQFKFFKTDLKVGFADPADTGQFFGFIWPSIILLEELHPLEARIEPSFQKEIFEGWAAGSLRIWPFKAIYPLFKFIFSKPTIKATWNLLEFRREKGMR